MDLSLFYFAQNDAADTDHYQMVLDGARFADEHDFTAVWTPERHFHDFGGPFPNPAVISAAIAAVTSKVQIRAGSVVAPLHHPARIAEEWALVDELSEGRAGVSFASGWHSRDFALRPEAFADRKAIVLEAVDTVRALWRGESVAFADGTGTTQEIRTFPKPRRGELPVWITSAGGVDTFRDAGRAGTGVLTHLLGQDIEALTEKIAVYREAVAEKFGPDGWPGHVVLMMHTFLGEDDATVRELAREPLCAYLRGSIELSVTSARGDGSAQRGRRRADPSRIQKSDIDFLVAQSYDRYYDQNSLLGTVAKAEQIVDQVRRAGVDEIACLVDFGLPGETVLQGLEHLDRLRQIVGRPALVGAR